jgi:hypothetical protein
MTRAVDLSREAMTRPPSTVLPSWLTQMQASNKRPFLLFGGFDLTVIVSPCLRGHELKGQLRVHYRDAPPHAVGR